MMLTTLQKLKELLVDAQPRLEGWSSYNKGEHLAALTFALRPKVAVELGVWAGRSALPVALALQASGCGVLWAVDPWSPEASAEGYTPVNADWWRKVANHEMALAQFLDRLKTLGLLNVVRIVREKSDDFKPPALIDLLHIDGQHTDQSSRDVQRFASRVSSGGIVVMDDTQWQNDGVQDVQNAISLLKNLGFVELYSVFVKDVDDFAVFQRV